MNRLQCGLAGIPQCHAQGFPPPIRTPTASWPLRRSKSTCARAG